ncbi:MAG: DUF2058 family protein [Pseudoxanthomonas sp.]
MSDSLRDQLLGLGFKPAPKPERKPERPHPGKGGGPGQGRDARASGKPRHGAGQPAQSKPPGRPQHKPGGQGGGEMDLAKAWAIRAQKEKQERIEAERLKQEQARQRREARAKLEELLKERTLNDPAADIARHFPYGDKIKRVHVNADQLKALNAGQLGVVQLNGRYLLVAAEVLAQAEAILPAAVALKVDPAAPAPDDPYADPKYQVPDDLVW